MKELIDTIQGLSQSEASQRLKQEGYNELPSQKNKKFLRMLLEVMREPMLILLLSCGLIYMLLGELHDSLMLLSFVVVVVGITFYQERKTEKALTALRNLSSPRALVIRDGRQKRIAGREVVREDVIIINEGDRIPADSVVLSCSNLSVDESLLTGEPMPVRKSEWDGKEQINRPGGDDLPFVYSGTLAVQGRGIAKVVSAGLHTEIGKIGKALKNIGQERTLIQKETGEIVKKFSAIGIVICLIVAVVYGLSTRNWSNGLLSGLSLSMAIIPEEFPVVLIIFLTLGAWRISRKRVLTRRIYAIETLGASTVLCSDKTGTLTLNSMILSDLWAPGGGFFDIEKSKEIPEAAHDLIEYSILASQKNPFDPIEKEVKLKGELYLSGTEHIHKNWRLVREYPLSKALLALSHVWESPDKKNYIIAAKGSPEAIADLCHFNKGQNGQLIKSIEQLSAKGLRVLGVAKAAFKKAELPDLQHDFVFEFAGLLGFIDPVRDSVPSSINEAYAAGMRVIMITGDYPGTAVHIAKKIGLRNPLEFITGPELSAMNISQLKERIKTVNIFARVVPEQKLAIVNALKENSEIVAMTGDGVNDAPALKSAHIGIAMGQRGTDVAREASALVLLNDDFSSIVAAVRMGRRIFDNLKKAVSYIFSVHVPIAGMVLLPVLFQLPVVLLPAHIAFLELIIDPACSFVFENVPEEKDVMKRPPRDLRVPLFNKRTFLISFLQGLSVLTVVLAVYLTSLFFKKAEIEARTLSFATLVFANMLLITTNLSWNQNIFAILKLRNRALWLVLGGIFISLMLVLYVPFLRYLFHFSLLTFDDLSIALVSGIVSLLWFEGVKVLKIRDRHLFF